MLNHLNEDALKQIPNPTTKWNQTKAYPPKIHPSPSVVIKFLNEFFKIWKYENTK